MSFSNPRRTTPVTPAKVDKGNALGIQTNMTLKKGATFHHSPTSESLPFVPSLPRRSNTSLDDVVEARRRRVALTLDSIDRTLHTTSSSTSSSSIHKSLLDKSQPFALGILDHDVDEDDTMAKMKQELERRVLRPRHNRGASRHHASDSGLGTSIASTNEKVDAAKDRKAAVAVTRSAASSTDVERLPGLSTKATNRIHEHILKPLLAKASLKDFQPVVLDCPRRMQEKEILCLRDLEKTLLLTAESASKTPALYLDFCLTTIECLQATVEYLNDREQTRPHERPYSDAYFTDLVGQIRHYGEQLAERKQKEDQEHDEMELDAGDEIKLHGGINVNGQEVELIRVKKDGTAYSLRTGLPVEDYEGEESKGPVGFKRSLSEQAEDAEEIERSMARRKKNATAAELAPKRCREPGCTKEFKRPCDLTKHEKTHSRPWKCPVPSCKYHEYGWPTEKEMDRHHNDKHSSAPPMYECWYKPCPYKSKRESNCKQHMEKAHGWTYVRTKTNGKKPGSKSNTEEPTPLIGNLPTPKSSHDFSGAATPPEETLGVFPSNNPWMFPTYNDPANPLNLPQLSGFPTDLSELQVDLSPVEMGTPSTESGHDTHFDLDLDIGINNEDIYNAHGHIPEVHNPAAIFGPKNTVAPFGDPYETHVPVTTFDAQPAQAAHISPIGEPNLMLYTPKSMIDKSMIDEGYGDEFGGDFLLYDTGSTSTRSGGALGGFPDLPMPAEVPSVVAGYSQPSSQDLYKMDWTHDGNYYAEQ